MTVGALAAPPAAPAQEVSLIGELRDAQRRTKTLCDAAEGVKADEPRVARRLYIRALSTGARNTRCAASGLRELATEARAKAQQAPTTLDKARALIENGYDEQGDELLRAQLAAVPAATLPEDLEPDDRALETAEALWAQGYETEAQEQVRAALAADPSNSIPPQLQKVDRKPVWLREAIGSVGTWLVPVAFIGGVLVLASWLIRVVLQHTTRRIVVEPFTGGEQGAAAALQAEMQDRYHAWTRGSSRPMVATAAGTDQGMPKPASLTEVVPQTGLLIDLVNSFDRLLPNRTWVLAGQFLPADPEQGIGLALRLYRKSNGRVIEADTLRQAEFQAPPAGATGDSATTLATQRLAIAGAAFFLYADRRARRWTEDYDNLGTKEWRSYAMANSAATYYPAEPRVARDLYRRALKHDASYGDARFGLAVMELRAAAGNGPELEEVERKLETIATWLRPSNSLWYRVQFWRVVSLMYREQHTEAANEAVRLFDRDTHWWRARSKLEPFLDQHRAKMLVVLASALRRDEDRPAPSWLAIRLRDELRRLRVDPVRGHDIITELESDPARWPAAYNLACYYAFVRPDGDRPWKAKSLDHLETALNADPELPAYAATDWSLQPLRDAARDEFWELVWSRAGRRTRSADSASLSGAPSNGPAPATA